MHSLEASTLSGAGVVAASGELDAYAAPDLAAALAAVDLPGLVVDFTRVSFLDSTVLGMVTRAVREHREAGRRVAVVLPVGPARRIFEITGLHAALPVHASVAEALAAFEA